jgi:hypothetical protein
MWAYENIYQYFGVCPGGGDAHVVFLVLLPLIELFLVFLAYRSVLISTIATVKYLSVATAVEQVDNNIIGDMEQEKELEGDFQAAMVMQHNHLDRTIRDLTSIKKVKERVNSQLRLAQVRGGGGGARHLRRASLPAIALIRARSRMHVSPPPHGWCEPDPPLGCMDTGSLPHGYRLVIVTALRPSISLHLLRRLRGGTASLERIKRPVSTRIS